MAVGFCVAKIVRKAFYHRATRHGELYFIHGRQSKINNEFEAMLADKLAAIEELRIELGAEGIECPGVLVVGAQSAGMSSVLERLTGIAFPRAENTCTRVPTIVQLQTNSLLDEPKAYVSRTADFQNAEICDCMGEIQEQILKRTHQTVEEGNPIEDEPIYIRYKKYRPGNDSN